MASNNNAKSLRLAAAYTSYGTADKILRRLMAYEVYGGLWRLTAVARGSTVAPDGTWVLFVCIDLL